MAEFQGKYRSQTLIYANMDVIPIWFYCPSNYTYNDIGAKIIENKTTGCEKLGYTCFLANLSNGTRLKPMKILEN